MSDLSDFKRRVYEPEVAALRQRIATLERERDAAIAVDRDGHLLYGPRWSLYEIEKWMKSLGADEAQIRLVTADARVKKAERERDEALEKYLAFEPYARRCAERDAAEARADRYEKALREIVEIGETRDVVVARAALAGEDA